MTPKKYRNNLHTRTIEYTRFLNVLAPKYCYSLFLYVSPPEEFLHAEARELFVKPDVMDPDTVQLEWKDPDEVNSHTHIHKSEKQHVFHFF